MIRKKYIFMVALAILANAPFSFAQNQPEVEVIEQTVVEPTTQENDGKIQIRVSKSTVFEVQEAPTSSEELRPFLSLPSAKQATFKENRMRFLKALAYTLNATKFSLGAGSLTAKGFVFLKNTVVRSRPKPETGVPDASFNARSERLAQAFLQIIDKQLWAQAPLLVNSNEYGISASISAVAIAGVLSKGGGGGREIGLSIAYNKQDKALVFEIFSSKEKFKMGEPFSAVVGLAPKFGFIVNQRESGEKGNSLKGIAHGVPFLPAMVASGENNFSLNAALTIGLPPSPLADVLPGFATYYSKETMLRITVSPFVKGFIRIELGNSTITHAIRTSFANVYARWLATYNHWTSRSLACSQVF